MEQKEHPHVRSRCQSLSLSQALGSARQDEHSSFENPRSRAKIRSIMRAMRSELVTFALYSKNRRPYARRRGALSQLRAGIIRNEWFHAIRCGLDSSVSVEPQSERSSLWHVALYCAISLRLWRVELPFVGKSVQSWKVVAPMRARPSFGRMSVERGGWSVDSLVLQGSSASPTYSPQEGSTVKKEVECY